MKSLWYKAVVEERGGLYVLARMFFVFLSLFYRLAIALRRLVYRLGIVKPVQLPCKVISVGNIAVGGTGKTPLVIYLAKLLSESGKRVGILARGYGKLAGGKDDEDLFGDIPNVIRIAQPDRLKAAQELIKQGVDVIILDDGFQHWRIKRDLDIVVIDSVNPFGKPAGSPANRGNKRLFPAGQLREPLSQLKRADMFVLTHCDFAVPDKLSWLEQFLKSFTPAVCEITAGYGRLSIGC